MRRAIDYLFSGFGSAAGMGGASDQVPSKVPLFTPRLEASSNIGSIQGSGVAQETDHHQLLQILDFLKCWWWETDSELRYTYFSASIETHTKLRREDLLGRTRQEIGGFDEDCPLWQRHAQQLANREVFEPFEFERRTQHHYNIFRTIGRPYFDENSQFLGYRGIGFDVTAERLAENRLSQTQTLLTAVIEHAPIAIAVRNATTGEHVLVNAAFEATMGKKRSEVIRRTASDIHGEYVGEKIEALDTSLIDSGQALVEHPPTPVRTCDNRDLMLQTRRVLVKQDDDDQSGLVVALIKDATEEVKAQQDLAYAARHDSLTGLLNRMAFLEKLEEAIQRQQRRLGEFALLLVDLDHFKQVNDTHGHPAGDETLQTAARRLQQATRDVDIVARLGGDEFAIIQNSQVLSANYSRALAGRVVAELSKPIKVDNKNIQIGASVGIAIAGSLNLEQSLLLKSADDALYQAKKSGRNAYRIFNDRIEADSVSA